MDLSRIEWALSSLVASIDQQTAAMDRLADSNVLLAQAMLTPPDEEDPDAPPATFMDGTPINARQA